MPKRYDGWIRLRTPDGSVPPGDLIQFARKKLGELMDIYRFNPTTVASRLFNLEDGSVVQVQWDGTTPIATIIPSAEAQEQGFEAYNLWVPRGFVVYPAFSDAKGGIGLPVIQQGDDPYARVNLAPGMDKSRWTAGGVCGEVLLSPDLNAAYPTNQQDVYAPLMFHPTRGPNFPWTGEASFDNRKQSADWKPYRIEFEMPRQHYADQSPANAIALFEGLNVERDGAGVAPLQLTPRGLYKKAEVATSIMLTAGSTADYNANYPPTYQHAYDRLTKDGITANMFNVSYTSWNRGDGIPQFELRSNGGGAASVIAAWMADPATADMITVDGGKGMFSNTGERGGYWCATVEEYTGWLGAGNASWTSSDLDVPIISWYSFASMNLAWETFPCIFDTPHWNTAPLVPFRNFTTPQGDCWLNYPRNANPSVSDVEPAMSRHIFSRGRRIAVAPNGGLIWGACVQSVSTDHGVMDRLIALVHHADDQPTTQVQGMTRYLRVWWCDIPKRTNLRLDPQNVISGTDPSDDWGWKGGADTVDLGVMPAPPVGPVAAGTPNSLKYTSVWKFARDGKKAVCLRDYGAVADYGNQFIPSGGPLFQTLSFLNPRAVELTFECTSTAVTTTPTFHNYVSGYTVARSDIGLDIPLTGESIPPAYGPLHDNGLTPMSVDYDVDGNLIYAYVSKLTSNGVLIFTHGGVGYAATFECLYYGTGNGGITTNAQLANKTFNGNGFKYNSINKAGLNVCVADVLSASWVQMTQRPWFDYDSPAADDPPCLYFTTNSVFTQTMFQRGRQLRADSYTNPDGYIPHTFADCRIPGNTDLIMVLDDPPNAGVQVYYGKRFGEEVFSYQFSPTPLASRMLSSPPSGAVCGCGITVDEFVSLSGFMTFGQWAPRGGKVNANIQMPPNDWLIYTKVV